VLLAIRTMLGLPFSKVTKLALVNPFVVALYNKVPEWKPLPAKVVDKKATPVEFSSWEELKKGPESLKVEK